MGFRDIKCKWYNDDGKSVTGSGCRLHQKGQCKYAHPDDSYEWERAERRHLAYENPDDYTSTRQAQRAPTLMTLSHRKAEVRKASSFTSYSEKKRDEDWSKAGPSKPPAVSSTSRSEASTSGWGETKDLGWGGGNGWGNGDSAWDSSWNPTEPQIRPSSPPPAPPAAETKIAPLPHSRNASIDFSSDKIAYLSPSLPGPSMRDPRLSSFSLESKGKGPAFSRPPDLSIDTQGPTSRQVQSISAGGLGSVPTTPAESIPPTPMAPPPVPSKAMPPPPPPPASASATATTSQPREILLAGKSLKRNGHHKEEIKAKISIMQAKLTSEERKTVYRKVIKYTQLLVGLQIKLNKMRATEENWKRNRTCSHYANSTQRARDKLNAGRREAGDRVLDLAKQRERIILELISLPDIPTRSHKPYNVMLDRQKVMDYTLELRSWIEELDIPRRLAAIQIYQRTQEGNPDTMDVEGSSPPPKEITTGLRKRKHVTTDDIWSTIEMLQERVTAAEENAYFDIEAFKQDLDISGKIEEYRHALQQKRLQRVAAAMEIQRAQLVAADNVIVERAGEATRVKERIQKMADRLADLNEKTAAINKANEQSEALIKQAEQKQQERSRLIEEMSDQLRTLIANRRSPSEPRPVRDITIDDIAPDLREELVNRLKSELQPVLEGLVAATRQAGEVVKVNVEKMVEPITQKTSELFGQIESLSVSS